MGSIDCAAFNAFCDANPAAVEPLLERVCDMVWNGETNADGLHINDVHRHDAINSTISGTATIDGKEYRFIIDNGDRAGTVVREWGTDETVGIYQPPPPPEYDMVPVQDFTPKNSFRWMTYLRQRQAPWFAELIGKYAYDKHFAPGTKTETYWQAEAAKHDLKLVRKDPHA